jgi:hypothetical protein
MCPGGTVVAAASEDGRLVTNGMSQYSRHERNANAGIVVGVTPEDFPADARANPLAGIAFQRHWEEKAFIAGGASWFAPCQLVGDFLKDQPSTALGSVIPSYKPGVTPTDLNLCLPEYATIAMREALQAFGRQIEGFSMEEAVMTGVIECEGAIPLGRGRRLCRRDSLRSRGWHQGGGIAGSGGSRAPSGLTDKRQPAYLPTDAVCYTSVRALFVASVAQHDHRCDHGSHSRTDRQSPQRMLAYLANNEFRSLSAALRCAFGEFARKFLRAAESAFRTF